MSYTTIWLHCVWSTKNRECIISNTFRPVLLKHIRENARDKGIVLDYINLHRDHVHALINLGRKQHIADVMQQLKGESSHWINKMGVMSSKFYWQDDYFAVSVSQSHVERVRNYIKNQDKHHRKLTWDEEVEQFFKRYNF
ncbi:IS200/IS605 family transposase [Draconibacterium orientale]|uniref:IS200/IS605 family transposase n=1 Tax=Draconibacterium orientale TaxID=1168034 RepID=UPI002A0A378F|nr:IS200/IS605 family transposase [Draconibacterium orientale]